MTDSIAKVWRCDVDGTSGKRTLVVTAGPSGSWEITSATGVSPWIPSINGCYSFSTEEAAMSVYNHVNGAQKWRHK